MRGTLPFSPQCHLSARLPGSLSWHAAREIRTAWRPGQEASSTCKDHELCNRTSELGSGCATRTSPVTLNKPVHLPSAAVSDAQTGEASTAATGLARDSGGPGLGARLEVSPGLEPGASGEGWWPRGRAFGAVRPLQVGEDRRLIWAGEVGTWMALRQNLKAR